jgi:hypothetical protein
MKIIVMVADLKKRCQEIIGNVEDSQKYEDDKALDEETTKRSIRRSWRGKKIHVEVDRVALRKDMTKGVNPHGWWNFPYFPSSVGDKWKEKAQEILTALEAHQLDTIELNSHKDLQIFSVWPDSDY